MFAAQYVQFQTYPSSITTTDYEGNAIIHTETIQIQGLDSNRTTTVNWIAIGVSSSSSGASNPREMESGTNILDYYIYKSGTTDIYLDRNALSATTDNFFIVDTDEAKKAFTLQSINNPVSDPVMEIQIPASQNLPTGTYTDSVTLTLYAMVGLKANQSPTSITMNDINNMIIEDTVTINPIQTSIQSSVDVAVIDRGGAFDINAPAYSMDFGNLDPSESMSADMIVEAYTSYSLDVVSQYGSRMRHTTVDEYVDYTLLFDSVSYALSAGTPVTLVSNAPASSTPGDRYPIDIQIGSTIGFVPAGDYTDNMTFTITAN